MENPSREYRKFKEFLNGFLIRRAKGEINDTDFAEENFEYIRPDLDQLVPKLSLTEAIRLRVYFNDAFIFHLSGGVEKPTVECQQSLSPIPSFVEESAEEEQCSRPKKQKTHEQSAEISEVASIAQTPFMPQEQTPLVTQEIRRTITPLMQSTPLGVPVTMEAGGLPTVWDEEEYLNSAQAFVDNLISQIDISNIQQPPTDEQPIETNNQLPAEPDGTGFLSAAAAEVPFLRGIAEVRHSTPVQNPPERVRPRKQRRTRIPVVEAAVIPAKKKKKRIDFEVLRCIQPLVRSEEQTRMAEQSFIHVPLMIEHPGNVVNQIINSRGTPEKLRSHISQERLHNFSEVIRAYANERQISVAQPLQHSWRNRVTSQSTPQSVLQVSQISQPGELVCQPTAMDVDYPSAVPHSLLRQQPLLPIPERDSSVELPLNRQNPFDSSIENVPQPLANVSSIPLDIGEEQPPVSGLSQAMPQDVEILDVQQQTSADVAVMPLSLDPLEQPVSGIPTSEPIPQRDTDLVPIPQIASEIPPRDTGLVPIQLDAIEQSASGIHPSEQVPPGDTDLPNSTTAAQNQAELPATANEDISWFEILRPREGLTYPLGAGTRRRRRRKRRREEDEPPAQIPVLPEIPPSPPHVPNEPNFPVLPEDFSQQVTDNPLPSNTEEMDSDLRGYFNLIKEAGNNPKYRTWERFDPYLFNEDDNFEMYTYILKRVIKDDYVAMDTLFEKGTIRLEVAKGFRFILELKAMGLIEIDAMDSRITGFKFKPLDE